MGKPMNIDVSKLETLGACDEARWANRRPDGRIANEALARRITDRERDIAIKILGFSPEDRTSYETRYAATTGELRRWAMEKVSA